MICCDNYCHNVIRRTVKKKAYLRYHETGLELPVSIPVLVTHLLPRRHEGGRQWRPRTFSTVNNDR
jgi:hypothetical protein